MKWCMMSVAVLGLTFVVGCEGDKDTSTARSDRSDMEMREARRDRDGAYAYTADRRAEQDRMRQDRGAAPVNQGDRWSVEASSGQSPQGQAERGAPQTQRQNEPNRQPQNQAAGQQDQSVRTIEITARDGEFSPKTLQARPNEKLRLTLINAGTMEHNIAFELPTGEVALPTNVQPSARASLMVTAPARAGEYTFHCPVGDHREKGMTGKLTVAGPQPVEPPRQ